MRQILTFLLILVSTIVLPAKDKNCACGDYPTLYSYVVVGGTGGCCTGTVSATSIGHVSTYADGGNGTWVLISNDEISSADAQNACCDDDPS